MTINPRHDEAIAQLAAIVTFSEDAIISKDLNGVITSWNRGAERLFGYTSAEAVGQSITILIPDDHIDEEPDILGRIKRGEVVAHYETVRRRKDGARINISLTVSPIKDASGKIVGASKIVRDISERHRAEQMRTILAAIVESSDDAIISKTVEGVITSWNRGAQRIFGYEAAEAIGQPVTMLMPPERYNEEPEIIGRIRRGEVVDHYETMRRRKDGTLIEISLTVSPLRDATGKVVGASKIVRDITESKRTERALRASETAARRALADAEAASRTKDQFLAMLSHELRTPMSAILGWSGMLQQGMSLDDTRQGIEVIHRNARLQSQIIEDLLDMSRIVSGKFRLEVQTVNPALILADAVDGVRLAAEAKGVTLNFGGASRAVSGNAGEIRGDGPRLQQVFFNLLTNAVKFTPRGGVVDISCRRADSNIEVVVRDTGAGIRSDFLPHVFERFQQQDAGLNRQHHGLGLGLAIVKHLVELHGGTVRADSAGQGHGSTFTVTLPVAMAVQTSPGDHAEAGQRWQDSAPSDTVDPRALHGMTIMVTDDEADAREMIRKILERRGASVLTCGSAADALDRLTRHRPDVLLCDIGMPGVDGYGLITSVRALSPDKGAATPAIALTAFARSEDRTRSLFAGFQMHLSKPVEPDELVASIRSVAGR